MKKQLNKIKKRILALTMSSVIMISGVSSTPVEAYINTAPKISCLDEINLKVGDTFSNKLLQISAYDNEDGDLTNKVRISGIINSNKVGTYYLTVSVKDKAGETTKKQVKVNIISNIENTTPTITLNENITLNLGDIFSNGLLNISAYDKEDGDLTNKIKVSGSINTNKVGTYILNFSVTDKEGLSDRKIATINVVEKQNTPPTIELIENLTIELGSKFDKSLLNIKVTDKEDGDLTNKARFSGIVRTNTVGKYNVKVIVSDSAGLSSTKLATIHVVNTPKENTPPVLNIKENLSLNIGDVFSNNLLEISAYDNEDGNLTNKVKVSGDVNTNVEGNYIVNVYVTDSCNTTTTKQSFITVSKAKNTPPELYAEDSYIYKGNNVFSGNYNVKAIDKEDGELTNKVLYYTSNVKNNILGTYSMKLVVSDSEGLSTSKIIKVNVIEPPNTGAYNINSNEFQSLVRNEVNNLVNNLRRENGLKSFNILGRLENSSKVKSKHMSDYNYTNHKYNNQYIWQSIPSLGNVNAENILSYSTYKKTAYTKEDATIIANKIFNLWENSASHKKNMLNTNCNYYGFSFHMNENGKIYATQHFSLNN